jgi:hypothetical protein
MFGKRKMSLTLYRRTTSWLFILIWLPALVACNLTGGNVPAENNANASATAIFQTLEAPSAELTTQAGGQPHEPAATEQPPAETQPVDLTESPAPQPEQPTILAGAPITVTAKANTNCRSGPDKKYPKLSNLGAGLRSTVQGKDAKEEWWYILNPKKSGGFCWVFARSTTVEGDTSNLPIIEAMPLEAAQTQAALTEIPQAPVAPVIPTSTP